MKKKPTKSDLKRLDTMSDASIDYSDIAALDAAFFRDGKGGVPTREEAADRASGRGRTGVAAGPGKGVTKAGLTPF